MKRLLSMFLIVILMLGSIGEIAYGIDDNGAVNTNATYQMLVTGSFFEWSNTSGKWMQGNDPGSTYHGTSTITISETTGMTNGISAPPESITVLGIEPYTPTGFDFDKPNFQRWVDEKYSPDQSTYNKSYYGLSGDVTIKDYKYDSKTGKLATNYDFKIPYFDGLNGIDVKQMLNFGLEDELYKWMGYTRETIPKIMRDALENDIKPNMNNANVQGLAYFRSYVITYTIAMAPPIDLALYLKSASANVETGEVSVIVEAINLSETFVVEDTELDLELKGLVTGKTRIQTGELKPDTPRTYTLTIDTGQPITNSGVINFISILNPLLTIPEMDYNNNAVMDKITLALSQSNNCSASGKGRIVTASEGQSQICRDCEKHGQHCTCPSPKKVETKLDFSVNIAFANLKLLGRWSNDKLAQDYGKTMNMEVGYGMDGNKIVDKALSAIGYPLLNETIRTGALMNLKGDLVISGNAEEESEGEANSKIDAQVNQIVGQLVSQGVKIKDWKGSSQPGVLLNHNKENTQKVLDGEHKDKRSTSTRTIGSISECGGEVKTIYNVSYTITIPVEITKPIGKLYYKQGTEKVENTFVENGFSSYFDTYNGVYGLRYYTIPKFSTIGILGLDTKKDGVLKCESAVQDFAIYGTSLDDSRGGTGVGGGDAIEFEN